MSFEFVLRLVGMVIIGLAGLKFGITLGEISGGGVVPIELWGLVMALVGALAGLILTPFFTTRPARRARRYLVQAPPEKLGAALVGLFVGLIIAALTALPLSQLPDPYGNLMPLIGALVFSYFGIVVFVMRKGDLVRMFGRDLPGISFGGEDSQTGERPVLLDTSVIIDGRIADISQTGFIRGKMLVPRFVLNELQHIADSADLLRRNRGRRGLEMLNRLQKESVVPVQITDMDVDDATEVDDKLVRLARRLQCAIITNDFNLNRVAQLQGVSVLNINELANAVKAVMLPGETLVIRILQEGKEIGQGIGYLEDGTMVVVEEGYRHINTTIEANVTKVLQTTAGRMIFARPTDS